MSDDERTLRKLKRICFYDACGNDMSEQLVRFELSLEKDGVRYLFSTIGKRDE